MNREILFRGKHDGEWIEGFYKAEGYDTYRGCIDRTPYIQQLGKCVSWAVDPSTVGQYTGLTDKNGTRIFEGDIIRYCPFKCEEQEETGFVEWVKNNAGFIIRLMDGAVDDLYFGTAKKCKIIGNVHDNPELLKGEKNGRE